MRVRALLAVEWTLATMAALVVTHLVVEIVGAALLGYTLLFLLPFIGGVLGGLPVGVCQWIVLRRRTGDRGLWVVSTLIGFVAAWTLAMILAAVLFVPPTGLDGFRALLGLAIPTPLIGWSQSRVLRRWSPHTHVWVVASTVGWAGFIAIELYQQESLSAVNQLAGRLVSGIAGYAVASSVGATLLGSALTGAITGVTLAATLPASSTPTRT
jgi:hypothetical protein